MAKLMFSKTHEWILIEGNKGKIGLSDHAQKQLGDLVFVELPSVGDRLVSGKPFMNVESVKAVSEVNAPACGTIIAVNQDLETNPEMINQDAKSTWIVEIDLESLCDCLMIEDEYKAFIG